jgi:hypothetical protein
MCTEEIFRKLEKEEKFPFAYIVEAFCEWNFLTADKGFNLAARWNIFRNTVIRFEGRSRGGGRERTNCQPPSGGWS